MISGRAGTDRAAARASWLSLFSSTPKVQNIKYYVFVFVFVNVFVIVLIFSIFTMISYMFSDILRLSSTFYVAFKVPYIPWDENNFT